LKTHCLLLLFCAVPAFSGRAQTLPERYATYGQLIVTQMVSAPFPHPKRAEGHKYKDKLFTEAESYSDSTVAIFIPKGLRETGRLDFVVHFHGWGNHVEGALERYKLIEQLAESQRNAVLVVPQGPRDASDSFGGKLEDPDGFKRFMDEVTATLREKSALKKRRTFTVRNIIVSGHSGGYEVLSSIVDCGGLTNQIKEVWLFDALYAQTEKFLAWQTNQQGRLLNIYTEHGGTKGETEQMMATLRQRDIPFRFAGLDDQASPAELQAPEPIFLFTTLPHNDVLDKHHTFRRFLETSCLEKRK
jgi:hypothetical protein